MKITFSNKLDLIRQSMGADLIPDQIKKKQVIDLEKLGGLTLDIESPEFKDFDKDNFTYQGQKVILYIKDQRYYNETISYHKFHISNCSTINEFFRQHRLDKFVLTRRINGEFLVNIIRGNVVEEKDIIYPLKICKNCLKKIDYKKYQSVNWTKKQEIYNDFNISEYFEFFNTGIKTQPKYTDQDAPVNIYPETSRDISNRVRKLAEWKCIDCGINLSNDSQFLHAHHVNTNKGDNRLENFESVCIYCHAKKPGHGRMKYSPDYKRFINKYGVDWKSNR